MLQVISKYRLLFSLFLLLLVPLNGGVAFGADEVTEEVPAIETEEGVNPFSLPPVSLTIGDELGGTQGLTTTIQILLLLTILSLAPSILIMTTSFVRIVIVLSLLRQAIGVQQSPPNQIVIGLALFLTFFVMKPVFTDINNNALQPYMAGDMSQTLAFSNGVGPLREFMLNNVREQDLSLFLDLSMGDGSEGVEKREDIPTLVVIPAFITSELKTAFQIGFLVYLPFLVIDMVVASILMSMGMMMLPPVMISLPFKLMLFVLVDGWFLLVGSLVQSFH